MKTTLAYGKNFHFYQGGLSNNYVYLELEDIPYDVGYRRIMIAIPVDIWEVIRGLGADNLYLVNVSDEDLINLVGQKVDERIAVYEKLQVTDPQEASRLRFIESEVFGAMDESRERQLARGIEFFKTERARQREIATRMAQHKVIDIDAQNQ
jgi:hypothetical protein